MISLTPFYVMLAKIYWLLFDFGGSIPLHEFEKKYFHKYQEYLYPSQFGSQNLQMLLSKMIHVIVIKNKKVPIVHLSNDLKGTCLIFDHSAFQKILKKIKRWLFAKKFLEISTMELTY